MKIKVGIRSKKIFIASCAIYALIQIFNACSDAGKDEGDEEGQNGKGGPGSKGKTSTAANAGSSGSSDSTCSLTSNTTELTTTNSYGCHLLTRDTSSCKADREAQGLSGFWLNFSCTVTLTKSGNNVVINAVSMPDSKSYYYSPSDSCYQSFSSTARAANPNLIASQSIAMTVPFSPALTGSATATSEGVIGIALNGVAIYDNSAAPGDDIYDEEATFDWCDGHPDAFSRFHYHTEPGSISNADSNFVGILRDGFPVYGRNDYATGSTVTGLDTYGGKTSTTADSTSTSVYHYHLNLQSNGTKSAYFISAGNYAGTVGSCTGCQ